MISADGIHNCNEPELTCKRHKTTLFKWTRVQVFWTAPEVSDRVHTHPKGPDRRSRCFGVRFIRTKQAWVEHNLEILFIVSKHKCWAVFSPARRCQRLVTKFLTSWATTHIQYINLKSFGFSVGVSGNRLVLPTQKVRCSQHFWTCSLILWPSDWIFYQPATRCFEVSKNAVFANFLFLFHTKIQPE